jgi:hypothetical protein
LIAALGLGALLAQDRRPADKGSEHDFGDKILIFVTRPKDGKSDIGGSYLEKGKVRLLGDRWFLVGQFADLDGQFKEGNGKLMWTPLSEIIQMSEFDSIDAARKYRDEARKAGLTK